MKELKNCKRTNQGRRKVIVGTIAGATAAAVWHKPLLQSVVLPAHAQTSATLSFFATSATATLVSANNPILDVLIPTAYAVSTSTDSSTLLFEAEALFQGNGTYAVKIAAGEDPSSISKRLAPTNQVTYAWGWQGTMTTSAPVTLSGTGCAQNESAKILSINANNMIIQLGFEGRTLRLDLNAGSATLPSFPLPTCN